MKLKSFNKWKETKFGPRFDVLDMIQIYLLGVPNNSVLFEGLGVIFVLQNSREILEVAIVASESHQGMVSDGLFCWYKFEKLNMCWQTS